MKWTSELHIKIIGFRVWLKTFRWFFHASLQRCWWCHFNVYAIHEMNLREIRFILACSLHLQLMTLRRLAFDVKRIEDFSWWLTKNSSWRLLPRKKIECFRFKILSAWKNFKMIIKSSAVNKRLYGFANFVRDSWLSNFIIEWNLWQ